MNIQRCNSIILQQVSRLALCKVVLNLLSLSSFATVVWEVTAIISFDHDENPPFRSRTRTITSTSDMIEYLVKLIIHPFPFMTTGSIQQIDNPNHDDSNVALT